jgi:hypothetical protein
LALADRHFLLCDLYFSRVYCYYLQFNLHPEKISQGIKGVNGVKYILWSHSFDRIKGAERFGAVGKEDHFFFLHTFLWTFAPWCFVAFIALFIRLKNFFDAKEEWLSTGSVCDAGGFNKFFKLQAAALSADPCTGNRIDRCAFVCVALE